MSASAHPLQALVADDDATVRSLVARELTGRGFRIEEAGDGREAFDRLQGQAFDLVVTDLNMPYDGTMLVPWLLYHHPLTAMVVMTGDLGRAPRSPLLEQAGIVVKPFRYRRLREVILEALALREDRRALCADLEVDPAHTCVLTPVDEVWIVNQAWQRFARENGYAGGGYGLGTSYATVCKRVPAGDDQVYAHRALEEIRNARNGAPPRPFVYPCHAPWQPRWYEMSVQPIRLGPHELVQVRHVAVGAPY